MPKEVVSMAEDIRDYNIGESDYSKHKIQPWDIWIEYKLNPFDADIVKRVLRHKKTDSRKMDYEKIIHICKKESDKLILVKINGRKKKMDFNLYQKEAHETASYPYGTIGKEAHAVDYIYPALGLAEEAGEVAGKFAKAVRDNEGVIDEERKREIMKELGDVLWFVAECCTVLRVDMDTVAELNIKKLADRKARGVIHGSGDNR